MKLSLEEQLFLKQWIYDELHYRDGAGPAKRLQLKHGVVPADLGLLIAAAMPDPAQQQEAGMAPSSSEPPKWPWQTETLQKRLAEARALLAEK